VAKKEKSIMNYKLLFIAAVMVSALGALLFSAGGTGDTTQLAGVGAFDAQGYNRAGRMFTGTGGSWCDAQGLVHECMDEYTNSALTVTWNAAWDKGNREAWSNGPYNAEMRVTFGDTDFVLSWVGTCRNGDVLPQGECVWGEFAISGTNAGPSQAWIAQASPTRF
jgi:hypothetical protein